MQIGIGVGIGFVRRLMKQIILKFLATEDNKMIVTEDNKKFLILK